MSSCKGQKHLRTQPWRQATLTQPLICNQSVNKRIEARAHGTTTHAEHRGGTDRGRNDRSRTRRTQEVASIAGRSHFTRKSTKGFVLRLSPQHKPHATFMQPSVAHRKIASIAGRGHFTRKSTRFGAPAFPPTHKPHATFMQPLYIAICRVNKRIEARAHEQPLIAEHREGTDRGRNDRSRTRRTQEVASIAGRSHFTRKSTKGFVLRLSPQHKSQSTFMISTLTAFFILSLVSHTSTCYGMCTLTPPCIAYSLPLLIVMWCQHTHTTIHWV